MKNIHFLYLIICLGLGALNYSCEQTDLQKSAPNDGVQITPRGIDDCSECPNVDDCCCRLTNTGSTPVYITICGTTDGDAATCEAEQEGCEIIDGLSHSYFQLVGNGGIELFCMLMNRGFYIANQSPSTATLLLTCQVGSMSPQTLIITIPPYSRKFYQTDGECIVEECGH